MFQDSPTEAKTVDIPATRIDPLYRWETVQQVTGMKKSAAYAEMARGNFPRPVRIGAKAVAWRSSAIAEWINSREQVAA